MKSRSEIIIKQVRLEGGFKRGRNQSGGMFEATCSKRIGQHKKSIHPPFADRSGSLHARVARAVFRGVAPSAGGRELRGDG